ncbi:hypothetical protein C8Q74DRAFT_1374468 [Fomes fomentarius]|nr:hypothetical protein C8Q74DRAFT_1374468 [Fomes fomentarius]
MEHDQGLFNLAVATNFRSRLSPPLPDGFLGSPITIARVSLTGEQIASSLAPAASGIRVALSQLTPDAMSALLHWMAYELNPQHISIGERQSLITSWQHLDGYGIDFGGGKPPRYVDAVTPSMDGWIQVMEAGPPGVMSEKTGSGSRGRWYDEPVCLSMRLKADVMERLLKDLELQSHNASTSTAHTASPFHLKAGNPAKLIGPAVHGTTGILLSVLEHSFSVKRVVITSSCASVQLTQSTDPRIFSEEDWNEVCIVEVKEKGRDTSKTLAERAAWEFYEQKKSESVGGWYDVVVKGKKDNDTLANLGACYVDVRDFAFANALAVTKPEAAGNRILISARPFKWQDFVLVAHRLYPQLPAGNTAYDPAKATHHVQYMPDKQQRLLARALPND